MRNLVSVSTDTSVYAIDIATRRHVWRYPRPGMLAVSPGAMPHIVTGAILSDGNLDAIRLR